VADKFGSGIKQGSTSVSIPIELWVAATELPRTSVAFASVLAGYWRQNGLGVTVTCVSVTAVNSAWVSGGWVRVANDAVFGNIYRFDVPDAAFASGADWVVIAASGPTNSTYEWAKIYPLTGAVESELWVTETQNKTSLVSIAANVTTAISAASLALTAYSALTTAQGNALAASLALTTYAPLTTVQGNALAASLALTAYGGETTVHANSQAASLALVAYTGVSTALAAYTPFANLDATITSRASAALWTSTVAGRIDETITSRASAGLWTSVVAGRIDMSISVGFAALNNISVAQILAGVVDGAFTMQSTLKEILAYVSGTVVKTGDIYAYENRAGSVAFTNTVVAGGRTRT
jgi:hypothetical protein